MTLRWTCEAFIFIRIAQNELALLIKSCRSSEKCEFLVLFAFKRSGSRWASASPFHPPCRLFFVTFALLKESELSLRSELKPGYSLKSSQITDSVRIVLFPPDCFPAFHARTAPRSALIKSVMCCDCCSEEHQQNLLHCLLQRNEHKVALGSAFMGVFLVCVHLALIGWILS